MRGAPVEIMSIVAHIHTCRESIERLSSVLCVVSSLHVSSVTYFISGIENIFFLFAFGIFFSASLLLRTSSFDTLSSFQFFLRLLLCFIRSLRAELIVELGTHPHLRRIKLGATKNFGQYTSFFGDNSESHNSWPSNPRIYFSRRTMNGRTHSAKAFNSKCGNKCVLFSESFSCISSIESVFLVLSLCSHRMEHLAGGSSFYDFFRFSRFHSFVFVSDSSHDPFSAVQTKKNESKKLNFPIQMCPFF